jgi:hypothetical protein
MPNALVFDLPSFFKVAVCEIDDEWFGEYQIPSELETVKRIERDNIVYFIDQKLTDEAAPLIIIDLSGPDAVFKQDEIDRYVFDRVSTITRATYTNSVSIPYSWHFHSEGAH